MVAGGMSRSRKVRTAQGKVPDNIRRGRPRESATESKPPVHGTGKGERVW